MGKIKRKGKFITELEASIKSVFVLRNLNHFSMDLNHLSFFKKHELIYLPHLLFSFLHRQNLHNLKNGLLFALFYHLLKRLLFFTNQMNEINKINLLAICNLINKSNYKFISMILFNSIQ